MRIDRLKDNLSSAIMIAGDKGDFTFWKEELKKAQKALKRKKTLLKNGTY